MKKFENKTQLESYIDDNTSAPRNEVVASNDNEVAYNFDIGNGNWSKFCDISPGLVAEGGRTTIMPTDFSDFELVTIKSPYTAITTEFRDANDWSNLETINIPDEIETIEDGAFSNCTKLTRVVIGKGLKNMSAKAFEGCPLVELVVRSDSWDWKNNKFLGFPYLSYVRVHGHRLNSEELLEFTGGGGYYGSDKGPDWGKVFATYYVSDTSKPTPIFGNNDYSFNNPPFSSMEVDGDSSHPIEPTSSLLFNTVGEHTIKFTLSDPATIYSGTFFYCSDLTSVIISDSVTSIDNEAFSNCSSLTSINIPNSVVFMGYNVFHNCSSLTSVNIGNSVTSIGENTFIYCSNLSSVKIPDSVTKIGGSVFYGCSSLTSIEIPESVTFIGYGAFANCTNLGLVVVRSTVPPTLGPIAFNNSASSMYIFVPYDSVNAYKTAWSDYANKIQGMRQILVAKYNITDTSSATNLIKDISSTVYGMLIDERGAQNVTKQTSYQFSRTGRHIVVYLWNGQYTAANQFDGIPALTSVIVGKDITSLSNRIFQNNTELTSVSLENVSSIGESAFYECTQLTSITLPSSVVEIGEGAFAYCTGLKYLTVLATTPPTLGGNHVFNESGIEKLYVPAGAAAAYASSSWARFNIEEIPN